MSLTEDITQKIEPKNPVSRAFFLLLFSQTLSKFNGFNSIRSSHKINAAGTYLLEVSLVPAQLTAYDTTWIKVT
jgi:hypothetical protein